MKFGSQLFIAAASLALGFASVDVKPASAAILTYTFTVDSPTKTGNGQFSFDDETFVDGKATLQSLFFQFDGESNFYTLQDDLNFPDFPVVYQTTFSTGQTSFALDYLFADQNNPDIGYEIVGEDFTIFPFNSSDAELISGRVSYRKVPEPTILGGAFLAGSVTLMMKRKRLEAKA